MGNSTSSDTPTATNPNRRRFLSLCIASSTIFALPPSLLFASNIHSDSDLQHNFKNLSRFLLNQNEINPEISSRILVALHQEEPQFIDHFMILKSYISEAQLKDIEAFKASPKFQETGIIRETALNIIKAWYLGYTGERQTAPSDDTTQFITYTEALMYKPTEHSLPIPSYVKWGTNYWATPPKL